MHYNGNDEMHFLLKIQKKREEMCMFGKKYGLNANETINCSRELDKLLNEYYHLFQAKATYEKGFVRKTQNVNFYVDTFKYSTANNFS